jgi:F-box interacting protein
MEERLQLSLSAVFPDELIIEIFSRLSVKPLLKFRCLNNSFKTLISDHHFVQKHLKKSTRNPHLALTSPPIYDVISTIPISRVLDNSWTTTIHYDHFHGLIRNEASWMVAGSCNGLICLVFIYTLRFWNPATRTKSDFISDSSNESFQHSFGYDTLTETYKVVAFRIAKEHGNAARSIVKIFTLGDNSWRNIHPFPVIPLLWAYNYYNKGVYLSGTINWLAVSDYFGSDILLALDVTIDQYVILSLHLSTETHTQLLLPRGFDKPPCYPPKLVVLMDCLCFCHNFEQTHFIIWQMKDFGVQESWIQLYKISFSNFFSAMEYKRLDLFMLFLSENGDTLLLLNDHMDNAFIYNCRDNRVKKIRITDKIFWSKTNDYVESLVSTN